MKLLFKNKTKYTKQVYKEFVEFHNDKYHLSYFLFNICIVFLVLFCIILQLKYKYYNLAIIFCIVLTVFALWRFFHPISVVKKEIKSDKIQNEKEFTFKFYDKYFKIKDKLQMDTIKYYKLYKVYETNTFFYLYIDRTHAFLLNKDNFITGNPIDFSKFIKKKCWYCFKKVNPKNKRK